MLEKYYKILGLKPGVNEDTLKKRYRELALKYHPDVNKRPDATNRFREIVEAYEIIKGHLHRESIVNLTEPEPAFDYSVYEEIIREAREKAQERARMKYERLKAEKEFFENNDIILLLRYIGNYLALPLGIALVVIPVVLAFTEEVVVIFALMFFWIIGIFILVTIYNKRKTWFRPGTFTTRWSQIISLIKAEKKEKVKEDCFFSKGEKADSKPFRFMLLKVRDIKLRHEGPFMHSVKYSRKYKQVILPRSVKAFRIHSVMGVLKPLALFVLIILLPIPSIIWRTIIGIFSVLILSNLFYLIRRTRSKTSFMLNPFLILKITIWILVIISQTTMYPGFVLYTTDAAALIILLMLIFLDMFLDLILRAFPFYKYMYRPILKQPPVIKELFTMGYQSYLDLPIWSTVYPFLRWLF